MIRHFYLFIHVLFLLTIINASYVYATGNPVTKVRGDTATLTWSVTGATSCSPSYVGTQYPDNSTASGGADTLLNQWAATTGAAGSVTSTVWGNTSLSFPQTYVFKCSADSTHYDTATLTVNDCGTGPVGGYGEPGTVWVGGTTNACVLNGSCGTSNGASLTTAPTTNLCGDGSLPTVSGSGPWTWTCAGSNGGTSASCSAAISCTRPDGTTNTSYPGPGCPNWKPYCTGPGDLVHPYQRWSAAYYTAGTNIDYVPLTPNDSSPLFCSQAVCGTSNGGSFTSVPTTGLCAPGTASTVTGTGAVANPWSWTCTQSSNTATCSATLTTYSCGGAAPTGANFTQRGATTVNGTWAYATTGECTWSCNTGYTQSGSGCVATVADACGTANGTVPQNPLPTPGYTTCSQGTFADTTGASQTMWSWSCGTATCSAPKYGCTTSTDTNYNATGPNNVYGCALACANGGTNYPTCTPPTTDTCGPQAGTIQPTKPTGTNACSVGTLNSTTPADTTSAWNWTCGALACSASKAGCNVSTDTNYSGATPANTYNCALTCANGGTNYPTCTPPVTDSCGPGSGSTIQPTQPTGASACGHGVLNTLVPGATTSSWNWSCGTVSSCTAPKAGCNVSTDTNYSGPIPANNYNCALTCANSATNYPTCNQCLPGLWWDGVTSTCKPCGNGGCTGLGGSSIAPNGTLSCINGSTDVHQCTTKPIVSILVGGGTNIFTSNYTPHTESLVWSATGATSCIGGGDWTSTPSPFNGGSAFTDSLVNTLSTTKVFTYPYSCSNTGGATLATATATVCPANLPVWNGASCQPLPTNIGFVIDYLAYPLMTPANFNISCADSDSFSLYNNGSFIGSYSVPHAPIPATASGQYSAICKKTSADGHLFTSAPAIRNYSILPPPPIVSLKQTPATISRGTATVISWEVQYPTTKCALNAIPVCTNGSCTDTQLQVAKDVNAIITQQLTDTNDLGGVGRYISDAVRTIVPQALSGRQDWKAFGKKTFNLTKSMDFELNCQGTGPYERQKVRVMVTSSNEG